jgi:Tfp pilus assembly protein PilN
MPVKLNLLPENLQVSKGLIKFLKTTKALGVIFIVIFIIFCLGIGGLFIFSKISLTNIQAQVDQLKSEVVAQEESEQQLVLLKDRLAKISSIKNIPNASKNIVNLDSLFTDMSPDSIMNEANITSTKIDITLIARSNEDLSTFIKNLKSTTLFNFINLSSLGYSPKSGYSIAVSLSNKQ